MTGELGKASLDLEANLGEFTRNVKEAERVGGGLESKLEAIAAIAHIAEEALGDVKMTGGQAAASQASAEGILAGVRGISDEARDAARDLDAVRISRTQALESDLAGESIIDVLKDINRNANETARAIDRVAVKRGVVGRPGVGVGPFGSGFGRIGLLGTAIGVGAVTAPALAPAAAGLLTGIPTLAAGGAGALGTLALAFAGVGKAIGGDKKAFDELEPAQQAFVQRVRSMTGWLDKLKEVAGSSLFPGLTKGLESALSPGTVGAITTAVQEFGQAIGEAGAQWGRYFGSAEFQSIFGPLMKSGARNLGVLSDAVRRLFDSLGVLGRAGIPLVNWITDSIDKGAKLAQTWLHAKDASGGLARGMDEAKTSLRLVGSLFVSLLRVVGELGKALYPVSKVAVKDLADGLNALSGVIRRNQAVIREIAGFALSAFVNIIKDAAAVVGGFTNALRKIVGDKAPIVTAVLAIGAAITLAMGPGAAAIAGAIAAVYLIQKHWQALSDFFATLGREIINAFEFAWVWIERGAIIAALKVVEPFSHLPSYLGGWARSAKDSMQAELDQLKPPDMDWSAAAKQAGVSTGSAWGNAFTGQVHSDLTAVSAALDEWGRGNRKKALDDLYAQGFTEDLLTGKPVPHTTPATPKPPSTTPVFGKPPPFDKNLGPTPPKPPLIPLAAQHAEALASANASRASALGNAGGTAKRYLENELADLHVAEREIRGKLASATGQAHARLFAALTSLLNKQRAVRKQIANALKVDKLDQLQFALDQAKAAAQAAAEGTPAYTRAIQAEDRALTAEIAYYHKIANDRKRSVKARDAALQSETAARAERQQLRDSLKSSRAEKLSFAIELAKLAVSNAEEGSAAFKRAVAAEVKALKAEIAFYDRIAHNSKLSLETRRAAIEQEMSDRQELKALVGGSTASAAGANQGQFLSSFAQIVGAYAPNAFPKAPGTANPKTDTHLFELVHEQRQTNNYLRQLVAKGLFPASRYQGEAALAAAG